jgi:hypothetical protein
VFVSSAETKVSLNGGGVRLARVDEPVLDLPGIRLSRESIDGFADFPAVAGAQFPGIDLDFLAGLHIDIFGDALVGKVQLVGIEHLEQQDAKITMPELAEGVEKRRRFLHKKIREQDQPSAVLEDGRRFMERIGQAGVYD